MPYAEIPIKVPAYFPDLSVTSYYRKEGSHSTYSAVDLALRQMPYGRERGSLYWFYYFLVIEMLWKTQRQGILRVAQPPYCPHYHMQVGTTKNLAGVEVLFPVKQPDGKFKCTLQHSFNVTNKSGRQNWDWMNIFRNDIVAGWSYPSVDVMQEELKHIFNANEKKIRVYTNNYIAASDMQAKIDTMFGDGSTSQLVIDTLSQWIGHENATDLKDKILENPWVQLATLASIGTGIYFVAKELRYWNLKTSKK